MGKGTHKGGFKGKGFDKGGKDQGLKGSKGTKGSGKGPAGGCWTCGGPHFANECPHNQGRTLSLAEWFPSEWQGNVQELAKSLRVIEPPEEKPTVASSKNKLPERQPSQDAPSPPSPQVARSNTPAQRRAAQEEAGSSCCCTHGGDNCSGRPWTVVVLRKKKKDLRLVNETKHCVGAVIAIEPEGVCSLRPEGEWEEITLALDSGATETVIPPDILAGHELREGALFKRGVEYEVANGVQIPNMGEREFVGVTENGAQRSILAQVCDVNRGLLSVRKVTKSGNKVVFDEDGSYIQNKATGEITMLKENAGMYELVMWVKRKDF